MCIVRADVTDMLATERETKDALEKALVLAKKACLLYTSDIDGMVSNCMHPDDRSLVDASVACQMKAGGEYICLLYTSRCV